MSLSNADKQRAYRDRKKRNDYICNDFFVTKLLNTAHTSEAKQDYLKMIETMYDMAFEIYKNHSQSVDLINKILFAAYPIFQLIALEHGEKTTNEA